MRQSLQVLLSHLKFHLLLLITLYCLPAVTLYIWPFSLQSNIIFIWQLFAILGKHGVITLVNSSNTKSSSCYRAVEVIKQQLGDFLGIAKAYQDTILLAMILDDSFIALYSILFVSPGSFY